MKILEVRELRKVYTTRFNLNKCEALRSVSFQVEPQEFVAIMGESGSGKSTLLNIIASLLKPTSGQILLNGRDMAEVKDSQLSAFRREHLGFVFQDFNLLDNFSVKDNMLLPLVLAQKPYPEMMKKAIELVKRQTQSVELNGIYDGKVTKLMKFGAFVEVLPGKEGLLHISEISHKRVAKVEDVLKEGQEIKVKVITMEDENKFNLSMKALISKEEGVKDESAQ